MFSSTKIEKYIIFGKYKSENLFQKITNSKTIIICNKYKFLLLLFNNNKMEKQKNTFYKLCIEGNFKKVKKYYLDNPTIDVSINNDFIFCRVCYKGNLKMAKWLFSIRPTINVSINNEYVLYWAYDRGYLKIVKWLFSVKPTSDTNPKNKYGLRWAYINGHIKTAKYILQQKTKQCFLLLGKKLYLTYIDEECKIFNKKKQMARLV